MMVEERGKGCIIKIHKSKMRREGSISDFKPQRDSELAAVFRRLLVGGAGGSLRELFGMAARQPSSRFWVSEHRAAIVIRDMLHRNRDISGMKEQTRRMYEEIYRRVRARLSEEPGRPVYHVVFEVVNGPAPEFYLTPESAKILIYQSLKAERERRRKGVLRFVNGKWVADNG